MEAITKAVLAERKRIFLEVQKLCTFQNMHGPITGGPYSDEGMRGPSVEDVDLINRLDVYKVIDPSYSADYQQSNRSGRS